MIATRVTCRPPLGAIVRSFCAQAVKTQTPLTTKLCVLGGGQMCEAILGALVSKGVQPPDRITVYDVNPKRLTHLEHAFGIKGSHSPQEAVDGAEIVILAVKPQNVSSLAPTVALPRKSLLLSIVAGLTVDELHKQFHVVNIVRSMPNTPAMIQEGVTVWMSTPETSESNVNKTQKLLSSFGDQHQVSDEVFLDMATAVSGSGPAYVFLTMEAMIDAAVHLGFPRQVATKLVISTIKGSAAYALQSPDHMAKLRNNVTSPGGTTASALYELERGGFRTVVADAIWAAYRRALELGGNSSDVGPGRSKFKGK